MTEQVLSTGHRQGEQNVKRQIKFGEGDYEYVGKETDTRVAEAMAYAAKPLIDYVLNTLESGTPSDGHAVFRMPDGRTADNKEYGVVRVSDSSMHTETPYRLLRKDVSSAHKSASDVQVRYYDRVQDARDKVKSAQAELTRAQNDI